MDVHLHFDLCAEISFPSRESTTVKDGRRQGHRCAPPFQAVTGISLAWLNEDIAFVHCWHCPVHLQ